VTRGLFLAVPSLLVFGGLFAAADVVFETLVVELFGFDVAELFGHVFLTLFFAWISARLLWIGLLASNPENLALPSPRGALARDGRGVRRPRPAPHSLSAFVALQVRYLFGGAQRVIETGGSTYAEYARRGFFELVAVTALTLRCCSSPTGSCRPRTAPTGASSGRSPGQWWALLFVIVASALQRAYLYTQRFGLTELRLYTTIFMHWISVVLVRLVLTLLRARRDRFTFGDLTMAFAAVFLINVLNPDALIVCVNVDRLEAGRSSMPTIMTHLSADAALVLVESLSRMSEPDHRIVEEDLHALWANAGGRDWRT
jgi:hypothetical protein